MPPDEDLLRARLEAVMSGLPPLIPQPRRVAHEQSTVQIEPPDQTHDAEPAADQDRQPLSEPTGGLHHVVAFTRRHASAVAVVVGVATVFAITQVLAARAQPLPTAIPSALSSTPITVPDRSDPALPPSAPTPGTSTPPAMLIRVHVLGAVQNPGVVTLPPAARVLDAIQAAGGLAPGADPAQLNMAAPVPDGSQILVGTASQPFGELRTAPAAPSAGAAGNSGQSGAQLNLNTATAEQLDGLPGVGPVTAQHILDWRAAHGPFTRVEELQEVDGIGPKTYAEIAPHVRV